MELLRGTVLCLALLASLNVIAQEKPTPAAETVRRQQLASAQNPLEALDQMTPDEIAQSLGLPTEDQFSEWLQNDPSQLLHRTSTETAQPLVRIDVSIASQTLVMNEWNSVSKQYETRMITKVSTGRRSAGYGTKRGDCWKPYYTNKMHYSKQYDDAPMPWSVFYFGGFAIHGTYAVSNLGNEASHGCVRVHPTKAKEIFETVNRVGKTNTLICIPDEVWVRPVKRKPAPPKRARGVADGGWVTETRPAAPRAPAPSPARPREPKPYELRRQPPGFMAW